MLENFLTQPGYGLLFVWVLAEQAGLPIPSVPMLMAAGAMSANGKMSLWLAILVALVASMVPDTAWYEAGRFRGITLIRSLCRLSVEKDSCARQSQMLYGKYGAFALVIAKFVPGLNFAAPPLSGVFQMRRHRFLFFNAVGALVWITLFTTMGFVLSNQLTTAARKASQAGRSLAALATFALLLLWLARKIWARRRFLHALRAVRMSVDELGQEMRSGLPLTIVDTRHPLDLLSTPLIIPGAIRLPLEGISAANFSPQQDIVVYCTCPSEASSTLAVQKLKQSGIKNVRVLSGGLQAWIARGYATEKFAFAAAEAASLHPIWAF